MLYLIGLGLGEERDLTLRAIEIAKKCDCYCELYTSFWHGSIKNLEELIGKKIKILQRRDLEEDLIPFLKKAKERDIALFVPGDPLAATTHSDIVLEAKKRGIPIEVIHNASILSAIGEVGLQLYKYGKVATIPLNGNLENVKTTVRGNRKLGLHTLLLLDLDKELNLYMRVFDALKMLLKKRLVSQKSKVIVFINAGKNPEIYYDNVKSLMRKRISPPAVIIIPGKLHFREKEFLEAL